MMKAKTKNCVIKVAQVNDTHTRADTHTHTHTLVCSVLISDPNAEIWVSDMWAHI